ncbi:SufE family protein [Mongoliitalea lutea]|uniref:Fe-S metabolism protein SufE n=1 Tax=Mongoliitalea lutea TaxID=849756 RepID=A0A8J3CZT0_9BACT|nr:SufE family protein [Mongoliitalea lutea]GHB43658.1 Fe-S metabolism protein SufE [Mongoliitalea lutea]
MMDIKEVQEEIISEFDILGDDKESTIFYIMELGGNLDAFPEEQKTEENIIKGCQSKVWLTASEEDGKVHFHADSNTDITKGLISLLIRVLSGRKPSEIAYADLYFIDKIGMGSIIGSQRSNGLAAMIKQMKLYALAFDAKLNAGI